MKSLTKLLMVVVVFVVGASVSAEDIEFVANGSFENWAGGVPDNWTVAGGLGSVYEGYCIEVTDEPNVYDGESAAEVLFGCFDGNWSADDLTRSDTFDLADGQEYTLSAAFKGLPHPIEDPQWNSVYVNIGYTYEDGSFRQWSPGSTGHLAWTNQDMVWTPKQSTFTAELTRARVYISNGWISHGVLDAISVFGPAFVPDPVDCLEVWEMFYGLPLDLNQNCYINLEDFAMFADEWLRCNDPTNPACEENW